MKFLTATAVAATLASPAFAQDATPVLSGARIEARVGWDRPVIKVSADDGIDSIDESVGKSGVAYGVEAGYDIAVAGSSIVGIYAGIEDSSVKECLEIYGADQGCVEIGRNITAGARFGFATNNGIVYLKGGYSNGRATVSYSDPAFPADNFRLSENGDGYHLGAGGEVMFGRNLYGKLEYVYTNYGGTDYDDADITGSVDLERHQVVAGVGFRF